MNTFADYSRPDGKIERQLSENTVCMIFVMLADEIIIFEYNNVLIVEEFVHFSSVFGQHAKWFTEQTFLSKFVL